MYGGALSGLNCFSVSMNALLYLFVVLGGVFNVVQSGANAQLKKSLDNPVLAGITVYVTGLAGLLLLLLFVSGAKPASDKLAQTPWWAWIGGFLSIAPTMAGLMLSQKLGSAVFTALSITAALITSVLLDHLGWVGFEVHPANLWRVLGCGLMISGILLIAKF